MRSLALRLAVVVAAIVPFCCGCASHKVFVDFYPGEATVYVEENPAIRTTTPGTLVLPPNEDLKIVPKYATSLYQDPYYNIHTGDAEDVQNCYTLRFVTDTFRSKPVPIYGVLRKKGLLRSLMTPGVMLLKEKMSGGAGSWAPDTVLVIDKSAAAAAGEVSPLVRASASEVLWIRVDAIDALAAIGGPEAVDAILERLDDSSFLVRRRAALALGDTRDTRAVDRLVATMKDPDWGVRMCAAEALGRIGDPRAVEALRECATDSDSDVRGAVQAALDTLDGASAQPPRQP